MWKDLTFKERAELIGKWRKQHVLDYGGKIREYDKSHRFDDGGDTKEYFAGELPEVTITPTPQSLGLRHSMQTIIKDPIIRNQFYDYIYHSDRYKETPSISDNDKINRFLELYRASGYPYIKTAAPNSRPSYYDGLPFINVISVPSSYYNDPIKDEENIVEEMSHAYQFKNPKAFKSKLRPTIGKFVYQAVKNNFFDDDGAYEDPNNYEYTAHSIIAPAMHSYISGNTDNFESTLKAYQQYYGNEKRYGGYKNFNPFTIDLTF